ncbi:Lar family restriction alleviation protein [Morganella morganii]|uniref:Lar family restriction alleviation protein n=1 Tax=Morganella morganii TaxID=582 RepID=UPI000D893C88|nr:restriction alleviation protein, Lar family [Morganella morganii]
MPAVTSMYQSDFLSATRWFEMTEKTQRLKPCPFCGSSHVEAFCQYEEDCPDRSAIVRCHSCDAQTAQMIGSRKIDMAIAAWNRRAPQCEKE